MAAVTVTALSSDIAHGQRFGDSKRIVRVTGNNLDTYQAQNDVHAVSVADILATTTGGSSAFTVNASIAHATKIVTFESNAAGDPFTVDLICWTGGKPF